MTAWLLAVTAGSFWVGILCVGLGAGGLSPATAATLLLVGLAIVVAVAAALAWRPRAPSPVLVWLALIVAFWHLGAGWSALREARVRASPIRRLAGHVVRVVGTLLSDPEEGMVGWSASLRTDEVVPTVFTIGGAYRLHDTVWISGRGRMPALGAGDRVTLEGTLEVTEGSFGEYLRHRGYSASVQAEEVRRRGPPANPVMRVAGVVRSTLRSSVLRVVSPREGGLLMGLVLGDTSRLDAGVEESFRATGLSHLTAVSGENVAMFLAPVMGLAMWLGLGRRGRFLVGLGAIAFFVLLTRAEPSVMRAAVMAGLAMLGVFLGRPRSPPAIMGGAILVLLGINPTLVYSIGFQLSVAATAGMAILATPLAERMRVLPQWLALAAGTTLGAQAGVTPVILYHFGAVPTVTLPANLLAFPAVSPGMLLGLVAAALGIVWRTGGRAIAVAAELPLRYLEGLAARLAKSPLPSITSKGGSLFGLFVGLALVGAAGWWLHARRRLPRAVKVACLAVLPVLLWVHAVSAGPPGHLTVTFFDVGQGDSALLRSAGGADILVDGGPDTELVAGKLAALGIRRVDVVIATHPHADHVAGLAVVLSRYPVGLVVDPGCAGDSPYYADFLRAVEDAHVPVRHPRPHSEIRVADVILQFLGPSHCYAGTNSDPNNDSLVFRAMAPGASILFPGDAEQPEQQDVLNREPGSLQAMVLKVAHHGGDTSLDAFAAAVHARVAIVSVGPNTYGHPVPRVLDILAHDGMRVFRTDRYGDVTVVFDPRGLLIESKGHG